MGAVSERLKAFLEQRLSSLDQIAVVMLLRADPARSWTAPEVAAALETAPETAAMRLFLLASGGLIAFEPSVIRDTATQRRCGDELDASGTERSARRESRGGDGRRGIAS